jgi:hypothetical protein
VIKSIYFILFVYLIGISSATENSPSPFEERLDGIQSKFLSDYHHLTSENSQLRQKIAIFPNGLISLRIPVSPSNTLGGQVNPSHDPIVSLIDRLQAKILGVINPLICENTFLLSHLEHLKSTHQVKKTKEEAPKPPNDFTALDAVQARALGLLSELIVENTRLKGLLPVNILLPKVTPFTFPLCPKREEFLDSGAFENALIDTLQARIMGRLNSIMQENERIRQLLAGGQKVLVKSLVEEKGNETITLEIESVSVTLERPRRSSSRLTLASRPRDETPKLSRSTTGSSASTPELKRLNGRSKSSTKDLRKEDGEYGEFKVQLLKLELGRDVVMILDDCPELKIIIEAKLIAYKKTNIFHFDANRKELILRLVECTNDQEIRDILEESASASAVHRPDRKGHVEIEEFVETIKKEVIHEREMALKQKQHQRVFDAIPTFDPPLNEDDIKAKITQVIAEYVGGWITVVQTGSTDILEALIISLKKAESSHKANELLDKLLEQSTKNRHRKERADASATIRRVVEKGTFNFIPGILNLNDIPHHGKNLTSFESHFYAHLKYDYPNPTLGPKLEAFLLSPSTGIFVSHHTQVDSTDCLSVPYRLLILKTRHLARIEASLSSQGLTPKHYISAFVYYKMRVPMHQCAVLEKFTMPPYQLWYFHASINGNLGEGCTYAINGDDVVSFNIPTLDMIPGHVSDHFKRAHILSKKDKAFNADL